MSDFSQGDIIKVEGYRDCFIIVSNNSFIRHTGAFHVCPVIKKCKEGPLHIKVKGRKGAAGVVVCEQIKLMDPSSRSCSPMDMVPYDMIMNISDAVQGMFEYD